jgi:hypothetical protein
MALNGFDDLSQNIIMFPFWLKELYSSSNVVYCYDKSFGALDPCYYGYVHCLSFIFICVPSKLTFEEV